MSEVLLQTIVEKLEALSAAFLKLDKTGTDQAMLEVLSKDIKLFQSEIRTFRENFKLIDDKISELIKTVNKHAFQLEKPIKNCVEHRHHLHKGIFITALFLNICIFLAIAWNNALQTQKQYEANDIKYRSLKATGDKGLIKLLYHTDSLYDVNAEAIRKRTIQEEQHLAEQVEMLQLAGKKKKR